jgi:hypothetical protein
MRKNEATPIRTIANQYDQHEKHRLCLQVKAPLSILAMIRHVADKEHGLLDEKQPLPACTPEDTTH